MYRNDIRQQPLFARRKGIFRLGRLTIVLTLAAFFCMIALGVAFLCGGPGDVLAIVLGYIVGAGIALGFIVFIVFPFCWPIFVAGTVSSVIVTERARQTWDTLLTLPFDRAELLMVKTAVTMRNLQALIPLWLWSQAILAVAFLASQDYRGVSALMMILATIEFAIARVQDYALACVIGLFVSLRAGRRETAAPIAVLAGLALVTVRFLETLPFLAYVPPTRIGSFPSLILLIAMGPSSAEALALPNVVGAVILILMVVAREAAVRRGFGLLLEHLGGQS